MKADYKFGNLAIFIPWFVNNDCKQEGIPVGCIQTTVVAATDVRTWEGSTSWIGVCLLGGVSGSQRVCLTPYKMDHGTDHTPSPRMDHGTDHTPPPGWTMGRVCLLGWGVPTRGCLALRGSALHPTRWTMGQTTPPGWTRKHKQNIEFRPKFREIVENGGILCRKCI